MSTTTDLTREIREASEVVQANQKIIEKSINESIAEGQKRSEQLQEAIGRLESLMAEQERYKAMNPVRQFFYRLFYRPAWL